MPGVLSKLLCARRCLHRDLAGRVTEKTLQRYGRIFDRLAAFAETCIVDESLEDLDALEYIIQEFRDAENLSKTLHQRVVTAAEFFLPAFKGKLRIAREAVRGRHRLEPTVHTKASTSRIVFLFACTLASEHRARVGAGMVLQCQTGLRPDELLDIRCLDVSIPDNPDEPILIAIGTRKHTKAKRAQYISLDPVRHAESRFLIILLVRATESADGLLFPFSYWVFHSAIRELDQRLGLNIGLSGHSGRACFATESIAIYKLPTSEVMREGRWLSESSFRMYVDVVGASSAQSNFIARGLGKAADFCRANLASYFILKTLQDEKHGITRRSEKKIFLDRSEVHFEAGSREPASSSYAAGAADKQSTKRVGKGSRSYGQLGAERRSDSAELRSESTAGVTVAKGSSKGARGKSSSKGGGKSSSKTVGKGKFSRLAAQR